MLKSNLEAMCRCIDQDLIDIEDLTPEQYEAYMVHTHGLYPDDDRDFQPGCAELVDAAEEEAYAAIHVYDLVDNGVIEYYQLSHTQAIEYRAEKELRDAIDEQRLADAEARVEASLFATPGDLPF